MTHSIPDADGRRADHRAGHDAHHRRLQVRPDAGRRQARRRRRAWPSSGGEGLLLLCGDSTNADRAGLLAQRGGRRARTCEEVFARCEGRIVVTCFASNIHRVQQVVDAAARARAQGRRSSGARCARTSTSAARSGHIDVPEGSLVQPREIDDFPDHKLVIISTGSQGEPLSALRRMAHRDHPQVELHDGRHGRLLGHADPRQRARGQRDDRPALPHRLRRDHDRATRPIHASGHGYAEEIKLMLNLMRPRYVMPFHGDHKRIHLHGQLAEAVGVDARRHLQGRERPAAGARRASGARFGKREQSGMIFVDGVDIGDPTDVALRDRRMLSRRRHLRRRGDDLRAGRRVGAPSPRSSSAACPYPGRAPTSAAGRDPRRRRGLARRARPRRRSARSTSSRRCCTTTWRRSSTTACAAARWCCRSSSRSERAAPAATRSTPDCPRDGRSPRCRVVTRLRPRRAGRGARRQRTAEACAAVPRRARRRAADGASRCARATSPIAPRARPATVAQRRAWPRVLARARRAAASTSTPAARPARSLARIASGVVELRTGDSPSQRGRQRRGVRRPLRRTATAADARRQAARARSSTAGRGDAHAASPRRRPRRRSRSATRLRRATARERTPAPRTRRGRRRSPATSRAAAETCAATSARAWPRLRPASSARMLGLGGVGRGSAPDRSGAGRRAATARRRRRRDERRAARRCGHAASPAGAAHLEVRPTAVPPAEELSRDRGRADLRSDAPEAGGLGRSVATRWLERPLGSGDRPRRW